MSSALLQLYTYLALLGLLSLLALLPRLRSYTPGMNSTTQIWFTMMLFKMTCLPSRRTMRNSCRSSLIKQVNPTVVIPSQSRPVTVPRPRQMTRRGRRNSLRFQRYRPPRERLRHCKSSPKIVMTRTRRKWRRLP